MGATGGKAIYRMIRDLQDDHCVKPNEIILLSVVIPGVDPQEYPRGTPGVPKKCP